MKNSPDDHTPKDHVYHHKRCETCERYTVHDKGKCTVCMEREKIIGKPASLDPQRPPQE